MEQFRLEDITFPLLMKDLIEDKYSGILFLSRDQWRKGIIFKEGRLCAIQSNRADELMGYILIEKGYITHEQNSASLEKARIDRIKHGASLISLGYLSQAQLTEALIVQIEKRFLDIFDWQTGTVQEVPKIINKNPELTMDELSYLLRKGITERYNTSSAIAALMPYAAVKPKPLKEDLPKGISIDIESIEKQTISEIVLKDPKTAVDVFALYCSGLITFEESKHKALIDKLNGKLTEMMKKTPYELLGVDTNVSDDVLKRAYIRLVKDNHPDSYAYASDVEVKDLANDIFTNIQKAYSDIQNERQGKPKVDQWVNNQLQAELIYQQARDEIKAKNYDKALDLLRLCVKMSPDEKAYNESLINAMFMRLQANKGSASEIKKALRDSIKRFPETDYFYLVLGWVLKNEGSVKAVDAFRAALRINPKNADASRELRLYQMRGKI
jgi:tetratricopeptide (TPR) repeat protein